jgi:hypothetical protein
MRGCTFTLCGALALAGCTDENAVEGRYQLELRNADDGCAFGWTPGGGFSSGITVALYEDHEETNVLAVLGGTPAHDYLRIAGRAFGGELLGEELVVATYDDLDTNGCSYLYTVEMRAQVRPNRFKNLIGQISYTLSTWVSQPGCFAKCVSTQELDGEHQ